MIFFFLNAALGAAMLWFSLYTDSENKNIADSRINTFINMVLIQTALSFVAALCALFVVIGQFGLAAVLGRIFLMLAAIEMIFLLLWCLRLPDLNIGVFNTIFTLFGTAVVFFIVIFLFDTFKFSADGSLAVQGKPTPFFNIDWVTLYKLIFSYALPAICILVLFFKYETAKSRLFRQQILVFILAIVLGEILFLLIQYAAVSGSLAYILLLPFSQTLILFIIYKTIHADSLYDLPAVLRGLSSFISSFIIPALLGGLIFSGVLWFAKANRLFFWLAVVLLTSALLGGLYFFYKWLAKQKKRSSVFYGEHLEQELAALDFKDPDIHIEERFAEIMLRSLDIENIVFMIESDDQKLISRYSKSGEKIEFSLANPVFSSLLNMNRRVVFRSHAQTNHELAPISSELLAMFDKADADAIILLNEGAHLFALILLGKKRLEKSYTHYDYETLSNLYSWFFLAQYYLKNIANEELVGTVDREIRFSSQIIQSIQQKKEPLSFAGYDADSFSVSARSLGGEFADFIRVDNKRHIIVIGDLSGRGLNASMSMVILKSIIKTFLAETRDFKELVQKVNLFIRDNLPRGTFFAGMFCMLDTSSKTLYYVNCALPALFMYNKNYNNVMEIQGEGKILGFAPDVTDLVKVKKVVFSSGDIFLATTDGLIISKSLRGEAFGKNRIQRFIMDNIQQTASKMCQFLQETVFAFTAKELEDDITAVVLKIL